jgi:hypothetical protein
MQGSQKEVLTIEPWAAAIGLGMLALVASAAVFTAWDREYTATLEVVTTPTAVGDTNFVREPAGGKGPIGLSYRGEPLDMVAASKLQDAKLIRVGMDESGVYALYRLEEEKEGGRKERLFMKAGVNEFVEVTGE